ncbi:nickel pincer cofactor biosynthesis protein LarC [Pantanalinema rosaneae CENA516]|uniref:nickel pincer cofactor biosynthesis protein LarC n=1 Tax=Pantanalinema rosaneae TaxID=1620701 RepID=UPI003D6E628F
MTKVAYLECPTGIAGDMCLGAIVDLGVPLDYLRDQLSQLGIAHEYELRAESVHRNGLRATKVHVELCVNSGSGMGHSANTQVVTPRSTMATPAGSGDQAHDHHSHLHHLHPPHHHHHPHPHHSPDPVPPTPPHAPVRHLPEIEQMILAAGLPTRAEAWSLAVFRQLAVAEAAVHGMTPEQVHFHEVGATDAIVDIVGTCLGLDYLQIDQLYCSALPTGGGTIRAAHGRLPVPAPAVLKLWELRQVPIYSNGIERELVTPTGAAIVTTLATQFGNPPRMTLQQVGLGAGSRELSIPNLLRLWVGETGGNGEVGSREVGRWGDKEGGEDKRDGEDGGGLETIAVLETQIDDLNPQAIGYVLEALLAAGALDVFTQAIGMKKSRPGVLLTIICHPEAVATCEAIVFRETSTLGIRRSWQERQILSRQVQSVPTAYGNVRVKVAWAGEQGDRVLNVQPEYEDCAAIARQQQLPWRQVHRMALQSWYQTNKGD